MQIVDRATGEVVQWEPGRAVELDFIEDITAMILSRGVGLFRTTDHVKRSIEDGLLDALKLLKSKIKRPPINIE